MRTLSSNTNVQSKNGSLTDELSHSNEYMDRFRLIADAAFEPIIGFNKDGYVFVWNQQAEELFGWRHEDVIGKSLINLVTDAFYNDIEELLKDPNRSIENNFQKRKIKTTTRNRFNKELHIELSIQFICVDNNSLFYAFVREEKEMQHLPVLSTDASPYNKNFITTSIINAQESERSELGQLLHDDINQILTTVKLYNEMLLDGVGEPKTIAKKSIGHLQHCITEIRSIAKRLSAPTLGKINLRDTIKELVEAINIEGHLNIVYTIDGFSSVDTSTPIHLAIYRIVQEQLNNIVKYAKASYATITIKREQNQLSLAIEDDGIGFNMQTTKHGAGIINMRTRVENLNGCFKLCSEPEKGCKVLVTIPLH